MNKKVIILGASGHAKVIHDIILNNKDIVVGFLDDNVKGTILDLPVLGKISECYKYNNNDIYFVIGIGNNNIRESIYKKYIDLKYYTAIHTTAVISNTALIGEGTVIMPYVVINSGSSIGKNCILNTACIVEHDNVIGDFVHLSPNVTLSGNVRIGNLVHLGTGTCVRNNINIISNSNTGVGTVIVKDIIESGTYIGVPARRI